MYKKDHNPPHFHALCNGDDCIVDINKAKAKGKFPKDKKKIFDCKKFLFDEEYAAIKTYAPVCITFRFRKVGQLKLSLNIVIPFYFFNLFGLFLTDSQYSPSEEWNAAYNLVQRVAQCEACRKAQNVNCPYRNGFRLSD